MERNRLHLLHTRDAIDKVLFYVKDTDFDTFCEQGKDYDAILMQVVVIGEAINELSDEFKEEHHRLPWSKAVGLRNRIAHSYLNVKTEIVWQTIKDDLPKLKKDIEKLL